MDLSKMDADNPQTWANIVGGVALTVFGFLFKKQWNKVDEIASNYMTRAEIEKALEKRDTVLAAMHLENTQNFREQREGLARINDTLIQALLKK